LPQNTDELNERHDEHDRNHHDGDRRHKKENIGVHERVHVPCGFILLLSSAFSSSKHTELMQ